MLATTVAPGLYPHLVDGAYDCVDRIVLRAYCRFLQGPAGFASAGGAGRVPTSNGMMPISCVWPVASRAG